MNERQSETQMLSIRAVIRKEFRGFFSSPTAYLFVGAFLAVSLFAVFWVEGFFARNIADVRPLFQWLPLLLIFLVAALTMRSWSEERRAGTLESLLTSPVGIWPLVLGKFAATLGLVMLAVLMTIPLPLTVSWLGPLDWGPVIGGYIATLFLAGAYIAIGLTLSARTDNPVVALILTALVGGAFYLIGANVLTDLVGRDIGRWLSALGTGSRFDSIARGVLDLRDVVYYLSLTGVFLALNIYQLQSLRWAGNPGGSGHQQWRWVTGLVAANLVLANVWLAPIGGLRIDLTADNRYTLSEATETQLSGLQEPLLIKGFFSNRTHPLLQPMVPRLQDLLAAYDVLGGDRVQVEIVDPTTSPEAEAEAASQYGIRPVPFQTADRNQSSIVNSYFDIAIAYGDQQETLGYQDLIQLRGSASQRTEVALSNPEYSITRAIRSVMRSYQGGGDLFAPFNDPVTLNGYFSPAEQLPESLRTLRDSLVNSLRNYAEQSPNVQANIVNPAAGGGELAAILQEDHGLQPQVAGLFNTQPFWFHLMVEANGQSVPVPPVDTLAASDWTRALENTVQRLAPGATQTIALVAPESPAPRMRLQRPPAGPQFSQLEDALRANQRVIRTQLRNGRVPSDADLLMVMAPKELTDKQQFAIDQFLMQGGSVVLATSPFEPSFGQSLSATPVESGITDWLTHYGVSIRNTFVLDTRSATLPVPRTRTVGGLQMREYQQLPYPHFPDLRGASINPEHPITSGLNQLTMNWVSPVSVDMPQDGSLTATELLRSSSNSWTHDGTDLLPDFETYPERGFPEADDSETGPQLLAVAVTGTFESYYQDRESPLVAAPQGESSDSEPSASESGEDDGATDPRFSGVIQQSPDGAKLLVVGSRSIASDTALDLTSVGMNTAYRQPIHFLQNAIDWSLGDPALLALRGKTELARTLEPLTPAQRQFWEALNYGMAVLAMGLLAFWRHRVRISDRVRYQRILAEV